MVFVHSRQIERYFYDPTDASLARLAEIMERCRYLKVQADQAGMVVTMATEPRDVWGALFGPAPALPAGVARSNARERPALLAGYDAHHGAILQTAVQSPKQPNARGERRW